MRPDDFDPEWVSENNLSYARALALREENVEYALKIKRLMKENELLRACVNEINGLVCNEAGVGSSCTCGDYCTAVCEVIARYVREIDE